MSGAAEETPAQSDDLLTDQLPDQPAGDAMPAEHVGAWIPHVVPFVAWIFLMGLLGDPAGWKYAVRSVLCLVLFCAMRPWRFKYPPLKLRHVPAAVGIGLFVFAFWVFPQSDFFARFETLHRIYLRVGMQMPWSLSPPLEQIRYAPELEGWLFALTRLAGSALVIAVIEEFFWRGWMYRWVQKEDFLSVDPGHFDAKAFWITAALFASIHHEWVAGLLCGMVYGWFYIRTRDIWAVSIAHVVTNAVLGIYVLWSGKYEFWA